MQLQSCIKCHILSCLCVVKIYEVNRAYYSVPYGLSYATLREKWPPRVPEHKRNMTPTSSVFRSLN